jgi:hypothetical protein
MTSESKVSPCPITYISKIPCKHACADRLDVLHHVYRLFFDGEVCATELENPQSVLDIGTGTGIWAMDGVCGSIFFSITLTFQLTNLQLPTNFQPQRWWV